MTIVINKEIMAKNKKNTDSSKKVRVDFRKNRNERTRENDWTRKYQRGQRASDSVEEDADEEKESVERVSGRGSLVRKRTIVGTKIDTEEVTGERGDFEIIPAVKSGDCYSGRVLKVLGLYSTVLDDQGRIFNCATRRILKTLSTMQRQIVVTGDRVLFRDVKVPNRNEGIIERVEPRHGSLSRTSKQKKHIIVTNVDQAVIVSSAAEPDLKPNLIDRFLLTCERSGIDPIICINKVDLVSTSELLPIFGVYSQMGYRIFAVSAVTGMGIERLKCLLKDRENVMVGQSGVGKSSLLNAIDPDLNLRVREISSENEKGKHTTTTAELFPLPFGGFVVDTPGIRQFMLWDIIPEEVLGFFRDLRPYENLCKYPDCRHLGEEGCAVLQAVDDGRLDRRRYLSYIGMVTEDGGDRKNT